MVEQEQAKATNLEILPSSKTSITKNNKFKRRSTTSTSPSSMAAAPSIRRPSPKRLIGRRVNTLKGLIPNSHECIGVDGLFRETADYILALQFKVQVMQTVIDILSNSSSD